VISGFRREADEFFAFEDRTDILSRNVGTVLPEQPIFLPSINLFLGFFGHLVFERELKCKVKFILEQNVKAQKGNRGIALLFLQPRR
jgi:hypothetical protein